MKQKTNKKPITIKLSNDVYDFLIEKSKSTNRTKSLSKEDWLPVISFILAPAIL